MSAPVRSESPSCTQLAQIVSLFELIGVVVRIGGCLGLLDWLRTAVPNVLLASLRLVRLRRHREKAITLCSCHQPRESNQSEVHQSTRLGHLLSGTLPVKSANADSRSRRLFSGVTAWRLRSRAGVASGQRFHVAASCAQRAWRRWGTF